MRIKPNISSCLANIYIAKKLASEDIKIGNLHRNHGHFFEVYSSKDFLKHCHQMFSVITIFCPYMSVVKVLIPDMRNQTGLIWIRIHPGKLQDHVSTPCGVERGVVRDKNRIYYFAISSLPHNILLLKQIIPASIPPNMPTTFTFQCSNAISSLCLENLQVLTNIVLFPARI